MELEQSKVEQMLLSCADEPIQFLGDVQDFGCLFAIDEKTWTIQVVSQNFTLFKDKPKDLLGKKLTDYVSLDVINDIKDFSENEGVSGEYPLEFQLKDTKTQEKVESLFFGYKSQSFLVFEHEFEPKKEKRINRTRFLSSFNSLKPPTQDDKGLEVLAKNFADQLKVATRYDRVMVYKFHQDNHGEVIAEAKEDHLEPYMGMHFPESDIPKQARHLYTKNLIRIIPDIDSKRVSLISNEMDINNFDLSSSITRHVSPVHIQYLKNMGVQASMSISIVIDGKLWGLVACHHYSPKFINCIDRAFLKFVGQSFSIQVSNVTSAMLNERLGRVNLLMMSLVEKIEKSFKTIKTSNFLQEIVDNNKKGLLDLEAANGFYIETGAFTASVGEVPDESVIDFVRQKIVSDHNLGTYYTECLSADNSEFEDISSTCSGVLSVGVSSVKTDCFAVWFRPEVQQEISWAGKEDKQIGTLNGIRRLTPRGSFEEVTRLEKNKSLAFTNEDIKVATEFIWFLSKTVASQLQYVEDRVDNLLEQARSKDLFISNLSHELRTPLNNILGWLKINESKLSKDIDLKEMASIIQNNSQQQLSLVNDLLDSTRAMTGKIQLQLEEVNLSQTLNNILKYFEPNLKSKNLSFKFKSSSESMTIHADPTRIEQIIRNVLQNSVKFSRKDGEIDVSIEKKESKISITIKDHGAGISKEDLPRVSGEFFQVSSHSKENQNNGMGLGLALVKNLTELHGGELKIDSEGLGKGTTVTLTFLVSNNSSKNTSKLAASDDSLRKKGVLDGARVLLVEDTVDSAKFVQIFLSKEGAEVTWVSNAEDALSVLDKKDDFHVVLTDIGLPDVSGLDFMKRVKELGLDQTSEFVALSAYGSKKEIQKSLDVGFKKHLVKPVDFQELIDSVRELL